MKLVILLAALVFTMTGCLKTRNEVNEGQQRQTMQQQVTTLQRTNADVGNRFSDLEAQIREMNGRVDVVENSLGKGNSNVENALKNSQQQNNETNQKIALLQEGLTKMERDILTLNAEIQALKADRMAAQAQSTAKSAKEQAHRDPYEQGEDAFEAKNWKQAILQYQKYRDESPKGKKVADATYKIGVSFQELGMKEEAKTFYDEVIAKYSKSEEARRARVRLKGLGKK
jgi:TolA-binding protein